MELALNLVWLLVSLGLGLGLFASRRARARGAGRPMPGWALWTGYVVLVALLLPAISMSDDLLAMVAPAEGEQIARRYDAPRQMLAPVTQHHVLLHRAPRVLLAPPALFAWMEISSAPIVRLPLLSRSLRARAPPALT
jgi:hypothetical protein